MARRDEPARSPGRRLPRRVRLARNPLRRPVDRFERWAVLVLVGMFLLAAPVLGWRVGRGSYAAGIDAERAGTYRVAAQLLSDPATPGAGTAKAAPRSVAFARWAGPDGTQRSGYLVVEPGSRAGQAYPVWINAAGDVVPAPQRRADTLTQTWGSALSVILALAGLLGCLCWVLRRALDRHRLAMWEAAWRQIAPQWTGRR